MKKYSAIVWTKSGEDIHLDMFAKNKRMATKKYTKDLAEELTLSGDNYGTAQQERCV